MNKIKENKNLLILGAGVIASGLALYYLLTRKKHKKLSEHTNLENDKLAILEGIRMKYAIDDEGLVDLKNSILSEFQLGLEKATGDESKKSSIKMLLSYLTKLPEELEETISYALDVGGTNARAIKVKLNGKGGVEILDTKKQIIPDSLLKGNAESLFDFFAACLSDVLEVGADDYSIGFTFSFPVDQQNIASGYLIQWTKGFTTSGVVGEDVVKLLNEALERAGIKGKITVLINDTVGTLIANAYLEREHDTIAGLILGTGTNAAYVESQDQIPKLENKYDEKMVINTEWGDFDSPLYKYLAPTEEDIVLDKNSVNFSRQHFEKMISGMYLGEIVRLELVELAEASLFRHNNSENILKQNHFGTELLSEIQKDNTETLSHIKSLLSKISIPNSSYFERRLLKELCHSVSIRSARLVSAGIAAIVERTGKKDEYCNIAIDGSLFEHYPNYSENIQIGLKELGFNKVILKLTKDGSGIGAAVAAAVISNID